MTTAITQRMNV